MLKTQSPEKPTKAKWLLLLALLSFSMGSHGQTLPENPQDFHIFLLMGQSNMEGSSALDGTPDLEIDPRVLKLNETGQWEYAVDPLSNRVEQGVSPGISFAKRLVSEVEDITVGLIPLAVGATKIADWSKGSELYAQSIDAANLARNYGVIKGILWHQGEHDGIEEHEAQAYLGSIQKLINDLRTDLRDVELPFIAGGFTEGILSSKHRKAQIVWDAIKHYSTSIYRTGYVRTSDIPYDGIHFTVDGQRILGNRYAEAYLRLTGHWTSAFKTKLDEEAFEVEDGWKFHPMVGMYFDEHYPLIKHAQMNWVTIESDEQGIPTFHSRFFGNLRLLPDPPKDGLYLYRPNPDPELILEPIGFYYVNLLAQPGDRLTFYDHTTELWSATIGELPTFESVWDFNRATETFFVQTQEASIQTVIASLSNDWSDVRKKLMITEEKRLLTIRLAEELFWHAHRNVPGHMGEWWKLHAMGFLSRVDLPLLSAQIHYQEFINRF